MSYWALVTWSKMHDQILVLKQGQKSKVLANLMLSNIWVSCIKVNLNLIECHTHLHAVNKLIYMNTILIVWYCYCQLLRTRHTFVIHYGWRLFGETLNLFANYYYLYNVTTIDKTGHIMYCILKVLPLVSLCCVCWEKIESFIHSFHSNIPC